ncbi:MAG: nucleoside monophosphate kinase [Candidatus Saccharibacteria bacterium]|nr:nucleoside monophosphate kinase [Candidatus Saccharibacteria bacterium]
MEEKINLIKTWLGTGSLNIFGLPMSGKDTVGIRLAEELGSKFLSSGMMIRAVEEEQKINLTASGQLIPTNTFYDIVLPYLGREDLKDFSLILSSVGRWSGEEVEVMRAAELGGHPIKAVVALNLSETEVRKRWEAAKTIGDRGMRADDLNPEVFETRIREFNEKTLPVLARYNDLKLLVPVQADGSRTEVFATVIDRLHEFTKAELRRISRV